MNDKRKKKQILPYNCISVQTHWLYNTDQFNQRGKPFYAICYCTFLDRTRIDNAFKMRRKKNSSFPYHEGFQYALRYEFREKENIF
jgi:hypothetical protein